MDLYYFYVIKKNPIYEGDQLRVGRGSKHNEIIYSSKKANLTIGGERERQTDLYCPAFRPASQGRGLWSTPAGSICQASGKRVELYRSMSRMQEKGAYMHSRAETSCRAYPQARATSPPLVGLQQGWEENLLPRGSRRASLGCA